MEKKTIQIDSVDAYNKLYGWETLHPLVTVVNHANPMASDLNHSRLRSPAASMTTRSSTMTSARPCTSRNASRRSSPPSTSSCASTS